MKYQEHRASKQIFWFLYKKSVIKQLDSCNLLEKPSLGEKRTRLGFFLMFGILGFFGIFESLGFLRFLLFFFGTFGILFEFFEFSGFFAFLREVHGVFRVISSSNPVRISQIESYVSGDQRISSPSHCRIPSYFDLFIVHHGGGYSSICTHEFILNSSRIVTKLLRIVRTISNHHKTVKNGEKHANNHQKP